MAKTPGSRKTSRPLAGKALAATVKRSKPGIRLERTARDIRNSDEFVEHVAGLRNRYRREHSLRAEDAQAALRQSIRLFHKHAASLASWLQQAHADKATSAERQALALMEASLPGLGRAQSTQVLDWLTQTSEAAAQANSRTGRRREHAQGHALRIAAEGLRATFERHKLTVSTSGSNPDAVRLLCAIARDAGDRSVQPQDATAALRDSGRRPPPAATNKR